MKKNMIIHQNASQRQSYGVGGFRIARIQPGLGVNKNDDSGFGPLGLVDHAHLLPGVVVPMHQHQNDEIFSYLRRGTMYHVDTLGGKVALTSTNLVIMNTGSGMMHEESVPWDGEEVELLQIFVRPRAPDLEPDFQQHRLTRTRSDNEWRLLAGPEDSVAPLKVRNAVWVYDIFLSDEAVSLPIQEGLDTWLYLFRGKVIFNDRIMESGDSAALVGQFNGTVKPITDSDLVCFLVNRSAIASRAGTRSG